MSGVEKWSADRMATQQKKGFGTHEEASRLEATGVELIRLNSALHPLTRRLTSSRSQGRTGRGLGPLRTSPGPAWTGRHLQTRFAP